MNRVKPGSGWEHLLEIARTVGLTKAYTWNPCVACLGIGCEVHRRGVCWAERTCYPRARWAYLKRCPNCSWKPHRHEWKMEEPIGVEGAVITPVSMGDLFGQKPEDIKEVLRVVEYCPEHVFAILTKLPQHALQYSPYPINVWFGVTVNSQADVWRLDVLRKIEAPRKYCLFEPLYGEISYSLDFLDLIVIGPQTKPTLQPRAEWVKSVLKNAPGVHVFMKSTLKVNIRNFGNELFNNV